MALNSVLAQTSMTLRYKDGIDLTGKDIVKSKKFSNIKVTANNQSIFDTAEALAPLLNYELIDILRSDDSILVNA